MAKSKKRARRRDKSESVSVPKVVTEAEVNRLIADTSAEERWFGAGDWINARQVKDTEN
jgi:hypothetical protein